MVKTVTFQQVMNWKPCEDFPGGRIADIFEGRETCTIEDVFDVDMRQDEQLWVALRDVFFTQDELGKMAIHFMLHVSGLADRYDPDVTNAVRNAILASSGNVDAIPEDRRHDRWASGATESEKSVALTALWAATARANQETEQDKRLELWNLERDWQVEHVKKKAGIDADTK